MLQAITSQKVDKITSERGPDPLSRYTDCCKFLVLHPDKYMNKIISGVVHTARPGHGPDSCVPASPLGMGRDRYAAWYPSVRSNIAN